MDNALRTISYIADIGNIVVLMARRRMPRTASQDCIETTPGAPEGKKQYKMICHVFESEDVSVDKINICLIYFIYYEERVDLPATQTAVSPETLAPALHNPVLMVLLFSPPQHSPLHCSCSSLMLSNYTL